MLLARQVRLLQARLAEGDQRLKELVRASQRQLDAASAEVPAHRMHTHIALQAQTGPGCATVRLACVLPSCFGAYAQRHACTAVLTVQAAEARARAAGERAAKATAEAAASQRGRVLAQLEQRLGELAAEKDVRPRALHAPSAPASSALLLHAKQSLS